MAWQHLLVIPVEPAWLQHAGQGIVPADAGLHSAADPDDGAAIFRGVFHGLVMVFLHPGVFLIHEGYASARGGGRSSYLSWRKSTVRVFLSTARSCAIATAVQHYSQEYDPGFGERRGRLSTGRTRHKKPVASGDGLLDTYSALCASGSSRNSSSVSPNAACPQAYILGRRRGISSSGTSSMFGSYSLG